MAKIAKGNKVYLNSNPEVVMTVASVYDEDGSSICDTTWFDKKNVLKTGTFDSALLTKIITPTVIKPTS